MSKHCDQPHHLPGCKHLTIAAAWTLREQGKSLFEIAMALGVSKEWLRTYAGLS